MNVNLKISVSGVRGIVGETLTPSLVADFAASFGQYVGGGRVVVARDTRLTGGIFENAVVAGLLSVGARPVLLGIVPTPTALVAVPSLHANGGIIISASHNPIEWNALKFVSRAGIFLNAVEASELLDIYNQPDTSFVPEGDYRDIQTIGNIFNTHKDRIFRNIDADLIRGRSFKVAVDCCNGAGALFAPDFLKELGCRVYPVFTETDGTFHRGTEPSPQNLAALSRLVKENGCDIGFAQDPDADRLTVVDASGEAIGEQYSLALAIRHLLSKKKGPVVVNLDTTKAVEDIVRGAGAELVYSKIGEINVVSEIIARNAVAGGEGGSGGIIWPAVHPCRDSFSGMAAILEMLAVRGKGVRELLSEMPAYFTSKKKLTVSGIKEAVKIIGRLKEKYACLHPNTVDGMRLDWADRWVLVRHSNTEPVVRVTAEALSPKDADELAGNFAAECATPS